MNLELNVPEYSSQQVNINKYNLPKKLFYKADSVCQELLDALRLCEFECQPIWTEKYKSVASAECISSANISSWS